MQTTRKRFLLIAILSTLTACATGYVEPPIASPHATLTFKKTISGKLLFRGDEPTIVTYQTYLDQACKQPVPVANFAPASTKDKTFRFSAGQPQRLVVNMVTKSGDFSVQNGIVVPTGPIEQHNCIGVALFTPGTGRSYDLSVRTTENAAVCVLDIVESGTDTAPSDLINDMQEVCGE